MFFMSQNQGLSSGLLSGLQVHATPQHDRRWGRSPSRHTARWGSSSRGGDSRGPPAGAAHWPRAPQQRALMSPSPHHLVLMNYRKARNKSARGSDPPTLGWRASPSAPVCTGSGCFLCENTQVHAASTHLAHQTHAPGKLLSEPRSFHSEEYRPSRFCPEAEAFPWTDGLVFVFTMPLPSSVLETLSEPFSSVLIGDNRGSGARPWVSVQSVINSPPPSKAGHTGKEPGHREVRELPRGHTAGSSPSSPACLFTSSQTSSGIPRWHLWPWHGAQSQAGAVLPPGDSGSARPSIPGPVCLAPPGLGSLCPCPHPHQPRPDW